MEKSSSYCMKIAALALAVIFLVVASLLFGSADVSLKDLLSLLSHKDGSGLGIIVFDIRLPRTLLTLLVGATLFAPFYVVLDGSKGLSLIVMTGRAFVGGLLAAWMVLVVGAEWFMDNVFGWHRDQCDSAV